jgi:hypothetical protein
MMRAWIALPLGLLSAGLLGAGCGSDDGTEQPDRPGTIGGAVSRIEDGSPIQGVRVILIEAPNVRPASPSAVTDDQGRYRFEAVPPGDYALFIYTDDLAMFDRSHPVVRLKSGATVLQNVRLLASALWDGGGYRVRGRVLNEANGEPIAGAFVSGATWAWNDVAYHFQGLGLPEWGVTDADGRFSVTAGVFTDEMGNEAGLEPISVTRAGFRPATLTGSGPWVPGLSIRALPLPDAPDSSLTCEVRLQPDPSGAPDPRTSGAIRGRALEDGRPIAGLRVTVSLFSADHHDSIGPVSLNEQTPIQGNVAVTDAQGRFLLSGLAPGAYGVHPGYLDGDGYWLIESPMVQVAAADTADAGDVTLARAIRPLSPAEGSVLSDTTPLFQWESFSDSAGVYVYDLQYATSHIEWSTVPDLTEPRWQMPETDAFAPDARVRWMVEVRRRHGANRSSSPCGVFEHAATFIVRG